MSLKSALENVSPSNLHLEGPDVGDARAGPDDFGFSAVFCRLACQQEALYCLAFLILLS